MYGSLKVALGLFLPRGCFGFSVSSTPPVLHWHIYLICYRYSVIVEVDMSLDKRRLWGHVELHFKVHLMDSLVFSVTHSRSLICFSVSTHSQEKIGMMWRRHRCLPLVRLAKLLWIVHKEQVSYYFEVFLYNQNCHTGRGWEIWGKHFLEV